MPCYRRALSRYGPITPRPHGSLALWLFGYLAIWLFGYLAVNLYALSWPSTWATSYALTSDNSNAGQLVIVMV
jgi:hypothetical protein